MGASLSAGGSAWLNAAGNAAAADVIADVTVVIRRLSRPPGWPGLAAGTLATLDFGAARFRLGSAWSCGGSSGTRMKFGLSGMTVSRKREAILTQRGSGDNVARVCRQAGIQR